MASYKITRRRGGGGSRRRPLKRSLKRRKVKTRKNIMKGGYKGTLVYDDGKRYEGQFTGKPNGKPNGEGTMTWPDGNTYTGNWNNGVMCGLGKMIWSNGNIYEGMWNKNNMNGKGKMIWYNGDSYDGDWKNGKRHGRGTQTLENKHEATGEWRNDEPKPKDEFNLKWLSDGREITIKSEDVEDWGSGDNDSEAGTVRYRRDDDDDDDDSYSEIDDFNPQ